MKQIILQDPETRINTLRHIFGIDKYKRILENTAILSSRIREEKKMREGMVSNMENDISDLMSKEEELENKHYNLSSVEKEFFSKTEERRKVQEERDEIGKKIGEKSLVLQDIEKTKIMISNKNDLISGNGKMIKQINVQVKELESLKFDESEILKIEDDLKREKRRRVEFNESLIKISSELNSLNSKNQENGEIKNRISRVEICPTCLQEVNMMYKNHILSRLNFEIFENLKKIESLSFEKRALEKDLSETDSKMSAIEKKMQEHNLVKMKIENMRERKIRVLEMEDSNKILEKEINDFQVKMFSLEKRLIEFEKFDKIFDEKQKALDLALSQERLAEIKTAELKKEIELLLRQIGGLREKIKKTEEIKKQLNYLAEIESWISKKFIPLISLIERNVMIKLKKQFSELFSEWFSMLVSEVFNAKLDDNFTPIIEQQDYEIDYNYLSGGERTAVALAYRLALNQVINSLLSKIKTKDIVVLDEPTDGFSSQQLDKLRDVLNQLNVKQLIIVSHEQKIESFVENIIRFKKVNGISVRE